jgi:hypothetical protein
VHQRQREMFVPLRHDPGHAQVDFGEALQANPAELFFRPETLRLREDLRLQLP